ncbi:MAG: ATP-dependent Clp protease proteolytic subunit [Planctomycetota bacterium]|nr:MAG: ATP-dependent Clp protease proteolytic subunit [Planctomycetota bacterium]
MINFTESSKEAFSKNFEHYLDHRLMESRTILISEGVSSRLTKRVLAQLLVLEQEDPEGEIRIFLNSPGGSADDGFAIYDTLKMISAPVKVICAGLVASAATILMCAIPRERRLSLPHSRIMMHQPSSGMMGAAADIEISAKEILKLRRKADEVIAQATGKEVEQIAKDSNRDFWLSPQEALDYGLIGRVVSSVSEI